MSPAQGVLPGTTRKPAKGAREKVIDPSDLLLGAFLEAFPQQREFPRPATRRALLRVMYEQEWTFGQLFERIRQWRKWLGEGTDLSPFRLKEAPPRPPDTGGEEDRGRTLAEVQKIIEEKGIPERDPAMPWEGEEV